MRFLTPLAAAGALAFATCPLNAQDTTDQGTSVQETNQSGDQTQAENGSRDEGNTTPEAADAKVDEKKICKRIKNMGSRFSEKVCMTKAEWDAQRRGTRDDLQDRR